MKLLVCDVEGTIFKAKYRIEGTEYASTMWQPIAKMLGDDAIEEELETQAKWKRGEYPTYIDWVKATVAIHKKYQLLQTDFYSLIDDAEYEEGVLDFFDSLDRDQYVPVLISGGFQELVRRAQKDLRINYGHGACEYIFDSEDGYLLEPRYTPCDFEGKYDYVKNLLSLYKLSPMDIIFIGDGLNDVPIAKKAALRFGINAHEDLKKVVHHEVTNFYEIDKHLKNYSTETYKHTKSSTSSAKPIPVDDTKVSREELLAQQVSELRKQNSQLKQELNDVEGKYGKKILIKENELTVLDSDYHLTPEKPLNELLDNVKVALIGFAKEHEIYRYFEKYHVNFIVIESIKKNFFANQLTAADVFFVHISYGPHAAGKRAMSVAGATTPYAILQDFKNIGKVQNAITNVLIRNLNIF